MNKERLNLLENYIKTGVAPLLIENIPSDLFSNSVVLKSNIDKSELNGHYEDIEFCPPAWYKELLEKSKLDYVILTCSNLNNKKISQEVYSLLAQI